MKEETWIDTIERCAAELVRRTPHIESDDWAVMGRATYDFFESIQYGIGIDIPSDRVWDFCFEVWYLAKQMKKLDGDFDWLRMYSDWRFEGD